MALEKLGETSVHRSVGSTGGVGFGVFDTLEDGRPLNPLINSGALTLLEKIKRVHDEDEIMNFCCTLGDPELRRMCNDGGQRWFDEAAVLATEADSIRNRGLCCYLASRNPIGNVELLPKNDDAVNTAVRLYSVADCLTTNTERLARISAILANGGCTTVHPTRRPGQRLLSAKTVRMTLSQMLCAGMYEGSGDWSREVGVPAKSGVSGAIMCVIPGVCGIGVYSPRIDKQGNSVRGMSLVRELVKQLPELSVFQCS